MKYTFLDYKQKNGAGINTLMSFSDGLGPSTFSRKIGKGASYERRDGWKSCLIPAIVGILTLMLYFIRVLVPICTLIWCLIIYVSRQEKS